MAKSPREPSDKEIEQLRYDERAKSILDRDTGTALAADGSTSVPLTLRAPYVAYEGHIRTHVTPGMRVLDLCGGTGLHSMTAARFGGRVTVTDIAPHNLELARLRAAKLNLCVETVVADGDNLPFGPNSFDVVTCAGSLSYLDHQRLLLQLQTILVPGGVFIFVDSLNHNPIYRLNRYIGYLRGRRSKSTLLRMPDKNLLGSMNTVFPDLTVSYYGAFSFVAPLMTILVGQPKAARLLDRLDQMLPASIRRMSFKIVGVGHLPAESKAKNS